MVSALANEDRRQGMPNARKEARRDAGQVEGQRYPYGNPNQSVRPLMMKGYPPDLSQPRGSVFHNFTSLQPCLSEAQIGTVQKQRAQGHSMPSLEKAKQDFRN